MGRPLTVTSERRHSDLLLQHRWSVVLASLRNIVFVCVTNTASVYSDITWRSWFELPRPSVYGYCTFFVATLELYRCTVVAIFFSRLVVHGGRHLARQFSVFVCGLRRML